MKAAVIQDYMTHVEIIEIEKPKLTDQSLLIEVYAASLNPIDNILRAGYLKELLPLTFPHVMGDDVSEVVVEVGKDVYSVKVGDAVLGVQTRMTRVLLRNFSAFKRMNLP